MRFKTILCDPPWPETGGGKKGGRRGADRHYPLMKVKDIAALPVANVADPTGCHLYLWVTNNFLPDGLDVMRAWGFRYVTILTWGKVNGDGVTQFGLGQYFRGASEHVLFGVRGNVPYKTDPETGKRCQSTTLLLAPRGKHSAKPEEMYERIERVSTGPMLEIFGRPDDTTLFEARRPGWTVIGNQATGRDVRDDLRLLAEIEK